jgi:hypothetical protein
LGDLGASCIAGRDVVEEQKVKVLRRNGLMVKETRKGIITILEKDFAFVTVQGLTCPHYQDGKLEWTGTTFRGCMEY